MSRVNENRDAQRAQNERRLQDDQKAKKRQESDGFSKLVSQGQAKTTDQKKATLARGQQQGAASNALLARHGIQANQFAAALANRGMESLANKGAETTDRNRDLKDSKSATDEKNSKLDEQRLDKQQDRLAPISRDDRGEGGGGGAGGGGAGGGSSQSGDQGGDTPRDSALKEIGGLSQGQGTQQAQSAHAAQQIPRIPPEALEKLVENVMVGVTAEGLNMFHIELKDGVLGGSTVQITAEDGKISAKFSTQDENVGRLLKASEGELARAFARKGMTLDRLEVETY